MSLTQKFIGAVAAMILAVPVFANTDASSESSTALDTTASASASQTLAADTSSTETAALTDSSATDSSATMSAKTEAVNINTADAKTLAEAVKGLGPKKAAAIIAYRNENGPFKAVDDLSKVKGITKKFIEKHRSQLTLG